MDNSNAQQLPPGQTISKRLSYEPEKNRKQTNKQLHALREARQTGHFIIFDQLTPPSPQSSISQIQSKNYVHQQSFGGQQQEPDSSKQSEIQKSQKDYKPAQSNIMIQSIQSRISYNRIVSIMIKDRKINESWLMKTTNAEYYDFLYSSFHLMEIQLKIQQTLMDCSENESLIVQLENKRNLILEQNNELFSENIYENELKKLRDQLIVPPNEQFMVHKSTSSVLSKQVTRKCFIQVKDSQFLIETSKKNTQTQLLDQSFYQPIQMSEMSLIQFEANPQQKQLKRQESSYSQITSNQISKQMLRMNSLQKRESRLTWLQNQKQFRMIMQRENRPMAIYFDQPGQGQRLADALILGKLFRWGTFLKQDFMLMITEMAFNYKLELTSNFLGDKLEPYLTRNYHMSKTFTEDSIGKSYDTQKSQLQQQEIKDSLSSESESTEQIQKLQPDVTFKQEAVLITSMGHSQQLMGQSQSLMAQSQSSRSHHTESPREKLILESMVKKKTSFIDEFNQDVDLKLEQYMSIRSDRSIDRSDRSLNRSDKSQNRSEKSQYKMERSQNRGDASLQKSAIRVSKVLEVDDIFEQETLQDVIRNRSGVNVLVQSIEVSERNNSSSSDSQQGFMQKQSQQDKKQINKNKNTIPSLGDLNSNRNSQVSEFTLAKEILDPPVSKKEPKQEEKCTQTNIDIRTITEQSELTLNSKDVHQLHLDEQKLLEQRRSSSTLNLVYFQEVIIQVETIGYELQVQDMQLRIVIEGGHNYNNLGRQLMLQKTKHYQLLEARGQYLIYHLLQNRINQNEGDFLASGPDLFIDIYSKIYNGKVGICKVELNILQIFEINPIWSEITFDERFVKENFPGSDISGSIRIDTQALPRQLYNQKIINFNPPSSTNKDFIYEQELFTKPVIPSFYLPTIYSLLFEMYHIPTQNLKRIAKIIGFSITDDYQNHIMSELQSNRIQSDKMNQLNNYAQNMIEVSLKSEMRRIQLNLVGQLSLWNQFEIKVLRAEQFSAEIHSYFIDLCLKGIPSQKRFVYWSQLTNFEDFHMTKINQQLTGYAQTNQINFSEDIFSDKLSVQCLNLFNLCAKISSKIFQAVDVPLTWFKDLVFCYPPKFNQTINDQDPSLSTLEILPVEIIQQILMAIITYLYLSSERQVSCKVILRYIAKFIISHEDPYLKFIMKDTARSYKQDICESSEMSSKVFWQVILLIEQNLQCIIEIPQIHQIFSNLDNNVANKIIQELQIGMGISLFNQIQWFRVIDTYLTYQLIQQISLQTYLVAIFKTILHFIQMTMQKSHIKEEALTNITFFCRFFCDSDLFISKLMENLKNSSTQRVQQNFQKTIKLSPEQYLKDYCDF